MNSQVSQSTDEVIFWQGAVATEPSGPQWGTGHPTFPPITHFPILSFPILSFQLFILKEKIHPKLCSFASSSIFSFFFLKQKYDICQCLIVSLQQSVGFIFLTIPLGIEFVGTEHAKHVLSPSLLSPVKAICVWSDFI